MTSEAREVLARIDAMEQTFVAKLETIRVEREQGDRQLEQVDRFIKDQVTENTKGLGQASAEIQTLRHDLQGSLNTLRDEIRSVVSDAIAESSNKIEQTAGAASAETKAIDERLSVLEDRWKVGRGVAIGLGLTSVVELGVLANIVASLP